MGTPVGPLRSNLDAPPKNALSETRLGILELWHRPRRHIVRQALALKRGPTTPLLAICSAPKTKTETTGSAGVWCRRFGWTGAPPIASVEGREAFEILVFQFGVFQFGISIASPSMNRVSRRVSTSSANADADRGEISRVENQRGRIRREIFGLRRGALDLPAHPPNRPIRQRN